MSKLIDLQKKFIDLRFGTFIHFNSATFQFNTGKIEDWEFGCENGGEPRRVPFSERNWNPDKLDCAQWAAAAKSAGCRFAALTTKHHEGFALWSTAQSEHCVRNAENKTDVVAAYLDAFRKAGITAGLYFSILDLTAGITRNSCSKAQKAYIMAQITELLTNYGEIPFLIVDGWNAPWGGPSYEMLPFSEINTLVKSLQPDCLLINIGCTDDINRTDILFFENGAGQNVSIGFEGPGILCQKLTDCWFWRAADTQKAPSTIDWAVEHLPLYAQMNVNLILNLSPNTHGLVDENLAARFAEIGSTAKMPGAVETIPAGWATRK